MAVTPLRKPSAGERVTELRPYLEAAAKRLNALMNMTCVMHGRTVGIGRLSMQGGRAYLRVDIPPGEFGPSIQTALVVSSSENPSTQGDSVTFSAQVVPTFGSANQATGTIQFFIDDVAFGSELTLSFGSGGTATSQATTTLTAGKHKITASYSGDNTFFASQGELDQQVLNKTTVTISASANPINLGQSAFFFADVSPSSATGNVDFFVNNVYFGTSPVINGRATSPATNNFVVGNNEIFARYDGDQNNASSFNFFSETVNSVTFDHFTLSGPVLPSLILNNVWTDFTLTAFDSLGHVVTTLSGPIYMTFYPAARDLFVECFVQTDFGQQETWFGSSFTEVPSTAVGTMINGVMNFSMAVAGQGSQLFFFVTVPPSPAMNAAQIETQV